MMAAVRRFQRGSIRSAVAVAIAVLLLVIHGINGHSHRDLLENGKENGKGQPDESKINKGIAGLIDGCIKPDGYENIRAFFGSEYADAQVAAGVLEKPKPNLVAPSGSVPFTSWLWRYNLGSDGIFHVPYDYNSLATFSSSQRVTIDNSLSDLSAAVGIVKFRYKTASDTEWISIQSGSGCWSYIGRTSLASGGQPLNLQTNGCVYKGIIQHEMMHALGFYHEQSRPDRDDYVTINWENIQSGRENNFQVSSNIDSLGSLYDYGSVMHYGATAFSSNGLPTIDANGNSIGQRVGASPSDVTQIRLLYQCASGIRDLAAYNSAPCSPDCKCTIGMSGCAGNSDACHRGALCINNVCVEDLFTPAPTTPAPTTTAPTPAPTTPAPTTPNPTPAPTTPAPTPAPTTPAPTTSAPTTPVPTPAPTTPPPTPAPTTAAPTTPPPTPAPTTPAPTPAPTAAPTTPAPTPAPTFAPTPAATNQCLAEGQQGCNIEACCVGLVCVKFGKAPIRYFECRGNCKANGLSCSSASECCIGRCAGGRNPKCS